MFLPQRKFLVSLLAFALFLSRYIVALSIRIILSPLPSLVATLPRALEDRSSLRDWFNRGFRHLACGLLHVVLFVTWDCRASLILDIGYLACYFVYNVKVRDVHFPLVASFVDLVFQVHCGTLHRSHSQHSRLSASSSFPCKPNTSSSRPGIPILIRFSIRSDKHSTGFSMSSSVSLALSSK